MWPQERQGSPADPLFPTSTGRRLSRDALEHRLAKYLQLAASDSLSLRETRITMHVLRHTAAIRLLQAGIDTSVIAFTRAPARPRSTSTPTSSSSSARARPNRPARQQARTLPATRQLAAFLEGL